MSEETTGDPWLGSWRKNESSDLSFIPSWHNIINYGPFPGNKPCTTTIPTYIIKIYVECILFVFIFLQISKYIKAKFVATIKESMFGEVRDSDSGTRLR